MSHVCAMSREYICNQEEGPLRPPGLKPPASHVTLGDFSTKSAKLGQQGRLTKMLS